MRIDKLITHCNLKLSQIYSESIEIKFYDSISGGSINETFLLKSDEHMFFIKANSADKFPGMFEAELNSLQELRLSKAIRIPNVIMHGQFENNSYLILEYIENVSAGSWAKFGRSLAKMHSVKKNNAGHKFDNYIGSLKQKNKENDNWIDFFINNRLIPQLQLANKIIDLKTHAAFEILFARLNCILPNLDNFSLLHGDLWSGNFLFDKLGKAVLFDPAIYYGHSEVDIAMTTLFGSFHQDFYNAYQEINKLETGWQQRIEIYNLYPLLVHLNLFGQSYLNSIKAILSKIS